MAIGDALSAIGGLVGGLASAGANLYMNERNNEANAAQARLQNQWNIEQWNRENEYNLPVNQVQRMKDAGLNPGLYYGQNQMMNEAAASPEMTSAAGHLRAGYIDPMMLANIGLINAQKDKTETEADVMAQKLPEELSQMRLEQKQTQELINNLQQDVLNKQEELKNLIADRKLTEEKAADIVWQQGQQSKEFQHTLDRWETERASMLAQIDRWAKQNKLDDQEIKFKQSVEALNRQEFEFNVLANVERLLGLKYDNANKQMDVVLKIDTHEMYGQQITLNGYDILSGARGAAYNQSFMDEYNGKKGGFARFTSHLSNAFIQGISAVTGSINFRLFGK